MNRTPFYRHIIWDWNGTLLDDAWLCMDVMNGMLRSRGMTPMTPERYQAVFDFPVQEYYRRLGFDFAQETFAALGSEFMAGYEARRRECRLQPHARELLEFFRQQGLGQSVLSAYQHSTLPGVIAAHGILEYFDQIVGIDDHYAQGKIAQGKALVARLELAPEQILLIGDTTHDHEVAQNMNIRCALVVSGNHNADKLGSCGVPVFGNLDALQAWFRDA